MPTKIVSFTQFCRQQIEGRKHNMSTSAVPYINYLHILFMLEIAVSLSYSHGLDPISLFSVYGPQLQKSFASVHAHKTTQTSTLILAFFIMFLLVQVCSAYYDYTTHFQKVTSEMKAYSFPVVGERSVGFKTFKSHVLYIIIFERSADHCPANFCQQR